MATAAIGSAWGNLKQHYEGTLQHHRVARLAEALFRGAGQVMLQNNPLTGALFLLGIFWSQITTPNAPPVGWGAVIGLGSSTMTALALGLESKYIDRQYVDAGLYGFNGLLVGVGLTAFLRWSGLLVVYIVLGAMFSVLLMAALTDILTTFGASALTAPFVLTTWLFVLTVYSFVGEVPLGLGAAGLPHPATVGSPLRPNASSLIGAGLTLENVIQSLFRGISQVALQNNLGTGLILLIALLINSRAAALLALLGSALGMSVALALGGDGFLVYSGIYGYNAVLCAIAIGSVFYQVSWRCGIFALFCAFFGTLLAAALLPLVKPYGLPTLTTAFILATWLFVLPKKSFGQLHPTTTHAQQPVSPAEAEANLSHTEKNEPG
jgi:urea transporter